MSNLRVLVILNRVPWPVKDGGTLAHFNLLQGLHQAGCHLTIAALNTRKHWVDEKTLPIAFTKLAKLHTAFVDNHVKVHHAFYNLFTKESDHVKRFVTDRFDEVLHKGLSQQTFDLIVFDGLFVTPYLEMVRSKSNAKIWLRQHNVESQIWETMAQNTRQILKKWYINLLAKRLQAYEQQVLNQFDALIALTQHDADELKQMGCVKPLLVLPVGIPLQKTISQTPVHSKAVFHLGAMDWQPNQQAMHWFLKEVWPLVHAKVPDAIFYMAGKKMPNTFSAYQSKSVKVVGEVDDARAFMQNKQIMIVPLFAGSGIRVKIIEGMSLGKSIVSTTLGAQGIPVVNGKHILVADNAYDFAQSIVSLLEHPERSTSIGMQASDFAHTHFDNEAVTQKLLNFYNTSLHT